MRSALAGAADARCSAPPGGRCVSGRTPGSSVSVPSTAGDMSTAMNFGTKSFKPRPPDKGAFPLDHFGAVTRAWPPRGLAPGLLPPASPQLSAGRVGGTRARGRRPSPAVARSSLVSFRGVQRLQGAVHGVPPPERLRERGLPAARHGLPRVPHGEASGGPGPARRRRGEGGEGQPGGPRGGEAAGLPLRGGEGKGARSGGVRAGGSCPCKERVSFAASAVSLAYVFDGV